MKVKDVELIVMSAENALSILRHSGDHWSLEITNVWMKCPTGYNLRVTNSSAYGVTNIGLRVRTMIQWRIQGAHLERTPPPRVQILSF